jgi:DNA repair protein RecO (recombination protein O)
MPSFSTPAILLRRIDFSDFDFIIIFFTLSHGKLSVIAKNAKKSSKRFPGILEPFSFVDLVYNTGRGHRLPVLQEASLKQVFPEIRKNIEKTAYASYWAELINTWMEEGQEHKQLFYLFLHMLEGLDLGYMLGENLSILFQVRFMVISGLHPNLTCCITCKTKIEHISSSTIFFDLGNGGIVCQTCGSHSKYHISFSKGTLKQLLWIQDKAFPAASKVRFSHQATQEGLLFLEAFVPYHLGKEPKSLKFLHQIRMGKKTCLIT